MSALQWIIKEAKKIKKEYPNRFTTWREYVAQASAIYASKHKGKSTVGKKKAVTKKHNVKKKVGAVKKLKSKHISESKVLHEIEKVKHDIKFLENLQKQHMMKKHKTSIGATIRKKHSEIKKLLKKY